MKFKFKKVLYLLILLMPMQLSAIGETLKVEKMCNPICIANKVSQPVNLSFITQGNWKLLAESVDSQIVNQDNPAFSLPITRLELAELNGLPISNFGTGKVLEVKNGGTLGVNNLNLALNVLSSDSDRPGNYTACIKFTLLDQNSTATERIYNLRFVKNEISSIDFPNRMVRLSLNKDKILQKNSSQNLPFPFGVYVKSNKDWKLYIRRIGSSQEKELNYFVKVIGGDQDINCNITNEYVSITENPILLASGKATINDMMNCLDRKLINIDYMVKGPENKFISAGVKTEDFEYRLETENR